MMQQHAATSGAKCYFFLFALFAGSLWVSPLVSDFAKKMMEDSHYVNTSLESNTMEQSTVDATDEFSIIAEQYYFGNATISRELKRQRHGKKSDALKEILEAKAVSESEWWNEQWHAKVESLAKPWQPYTDRSWCNRDPPGKIGELEEGSGQWFVKIPKCASSTNAAVALTLASNLARRLGRDRPCPTNAHHGLSYARRKEPSLMWSMIRDPAKRAISEYFHFVVSRKGVTPTVNGELLTLSGRKNSMYTYLSSKMESIEEILEVYHFIGLAERMDESHVVMKLLFDLEDEDFLTLPAKVSGAMDSKAGCKVIQKSFLFPEAEKYMNSKEFREGTYDYFLYAVINRSLDLTIDALGRDKVEREVAKHKRLLTFVHDQCVNQTFLGPCTEKFREARKKTKKLKTGCYWEDTGCGHECIYDTMEKCKTGTIQNCPT